jgi:hypothetical protein
MVSAKLNVLNWDSRMTPDFACILSIFACSGKTGWQRGRPVSPVLLKNCELTEKLGDFPAQSPYLPGSIATILSVIVSSLSFRFRVARHRSFEKTLHERVDTLLDAEKTS